MILPTDPRALQGVVGTPEAVFLVPPRTSALAAIDAFISVPPRTAALEAIDVFISGGASTGPFLLVSGLAYAGKSVLLAQLVARAIDGNAGKSVLLAQLVARAIDGVPLAPGVATPGKRRRRRVTSFLFAGGEQPSAQEALHFLAADVRAKTGGGDARVSDLPGAGGEAGSGGLLGFLERFQGEAGMEGWGQRALADAVVRAVSMGEVGEEDASDEGWEVVIVIDGAPDK
ncbi:hypothetical protein T484DRAFT_1818874, partial [Baffinella frigidus]